MTATLISLIGIFIGIIGANLTRFILKKYSFGIIGNTIAGVFGSIFFIKTLGKFGFDPKAILQQGSINLGLLALNILMSFFGGTIAVILIYKLNHKLNFLSNLVLR